MPKIKVSQFHNKNQFIIEDGKKRIFQSYYSTIAVYNHQEKKLIFGHNWNYSNTTKKHLYLYLNECVNQYFFKGLTEALKSKNKKKELQKLINNGTIKLENLD